MQTQTSRTAWQAAAFLLSERKDAKEKRRREKTLKTPFLRYVGEKRSKILFGGAAWAGEGSSSTAAVFHNTSLRTLPESFCPIFSPFTRVRKVSRSLPNGKHNGMQFKTIKRLGKSPEDNKKSLCRYWHRDKLCMESVLKSHVFAISSWDIYRLLL